MIHCHIVIVLCIQGRHLARALLGVMVCVALKTSPSDVLHEAA